MWTMFCRNLQRTTWMWRLRNDAWRSWQGRQNQDCWTPQSRPSQVGALWLQGRVLAEHHTASVGVTWTSRRSGSRKFKSRSRFAQTRKEQVRESFEPWVWLCCRNVHEGCNFCRECPQRRWEWIWLPTLWSSAGSTSSETGQDQSTGQAGSIWTVTVGARCHETCFSGLP